MSARPHDIAILGATGFTGSFVAEYLAERYPSLLSSGLKVAIAGRSKGKLETVRNDMINASNGALKESDVAILEYDAGDRNSVEAVVGSARVVIACSGPYTRVGTPVVAACVEKGTDYGAFTFGVFGLGRTD